MSTEALVTRAKQVAIELKCEGNFNVDSEQIKTLTPSMQVKQLVTAMELSWQDAYEQDHSGVVKKEVMQAKIAAFQKDIFSSNKSTENFKPFFELFEEQVQNKPNQLAVVDRDRTLTYEALNKEANKLAHHFIALRDETWRDDDCIGLLFENSLEAIITILAAMKAGVPYVPVTIDKKLPNERIAKYITLSKPKYIVTQKSLETESTVHYLKSIHPTLPMYTYEGLKEKSKLTKNPKRQLRPDQLAYIIFSSGSTGYPKGIKVPHRGLQYAALAIQKTFNIKSEDRVGWYSLLTFDASLLDIMAPLVSGACSVVVPQAVRKDSNMLEQYLKEQQVSIITLVPSVLEMLEPKRLPKLRGVISTGEAGKKAVFEKWSRAGCDMVNGYGPGEDTIVTSMHHYQRQVLISSGTVAGQSMAMVCYTPSPHPALLSKQEEKVIGSKAIEGSEWFIFAAGTENEPYPISPKPVSEGEPGELYLAGEGLALGYLNSHAPYQQRFRQIFHPDGSGRIISIYQTGDVVKKVNNEVKYLHRIDKQYKFLGEMIHPGAIEAALLEYQQNKEAPLDSVKVVIEDIDGQPYIHAYIKPKIKLMNTIEPKSFVRNMAFYLKHHPYCNLSPSRFSFVHEWPTNAHGKTDEKRLAQAAEKTVFPQSALELVSDTEVGKKLREIWHDLLKIDPNKHTLYLDDDFYELGGHSVLTSLLLSRISRVCDGFSMDFHTFNTCPTMRNILFSYELAKAGRDFLSVEAEKTITWLSAIRKVDANTKKAPVIFVHAISGDAGKDYKNLHALWNKHFDDRAVLSIRASSLNRPGAVAKDFYSLASYYLSLLKEKLGNYQGPIIFVGYSAGGILAYEMTKQTQARGQSAAVACIDSRSVTYYQELSQHESAEVLYDLMRYATQKLMGLNPKTAFILPNELKRFSKEEQLAICWKSVSEVLSQKKKDKKEACLGQYVTLQNMVSNQLRYNVKPIDLAWLFSFSETSKKMGDERLGWPEAVFSNILKVDASHLILSEEKALTTVEEKFIPQFKSFLSRVQAQLDKAEALRPFYTLIQECREGYCQSINTRVSFDRKTIVSIYDAFVPFANKQLDACLQKQSMKLYVEGNAWSGKTMLNRLIAVQWAEKKAYTHFDLVFWTKLDKLDPLKIPSDLEHLRKCVQNEKIKCLFLFDGYERLPENSALESCVRYFIEHKNTSVVISTRSTDTKPRPTEYQRIKLAGFDMKGVEDFVNRYFSHIMLRLPVKKKVKTNGGEKYNQFSIVDDGEQGYGHFSLTREAGHVLLSKRFVEIKTILKPAIEEALLDKTFVDYVLEKTKDTELKSIFGVYQEKSTTKNSDEEKTKLLAYADKPEIVQHYLNFDVKERLVDSGWSHPSVLKAMATLLGINVVIWVESEKATIVRHPICEEAPNNGEEDCHIVLTHANHFDALRREDGRRRVAVKASEALKEKLLRFIKEDKGMGDFFSTPLHLLLLCQYWVGYVINTNKRNKTLGTIRVYDVLHHISGHLWTQYTQRETALRLTKGINDDSEVIKDQKEIQDLIEHIAAKSYLLEKIKGGIAEAQIDRMITTWFSATKRGHCSYAEKQRYKEIILDTGFFYSSGHRQSGHKRYFHFLHAEFLEVLTVSYLRKYLNYRNKNEYSQYTKIIEKYPVLYNLTSQNDENVYLKLLLKLPIVKKLGAPGRKDILKCLDENPDFDSSDYEDSPLYQLLSSLLGEEGEDAIDAELDALYTREDPDVKPDMNLYALVSDIYQFKPDDSVMRFLNENEKFFSGRLFYISDPDKKFSKSVEIKAYNVLKSSHGYDQCQYRFGLADRSRVIVKTSYNEFLSVQIAEQLVTNSFYSFLNDFYYTNEYVEVNFPRPVCDDLGQWQIFEGNYILKRSKIITKRWRGYVQEEGFVLYPTYHQQLSYQIILQPRNIKLIKYNRGYREERELSINSLKYFRANIFVYNVIRSITVENHKDKLKIKEPIFDHNRLKLQKLEGLENTKKELVDLLSKKANTEYLDLLLDKIILSGTETADFSELIQKMGEQLDGFKSLFDKALQLGKELNFDDTKNSLLEKIVLNANYKKCIRKGQQMSVLKIMTLLNDAFMHIDKMKDKPLVLVEGNTGAGKSTFVNFILGVLLKKIQDKYGQYSIVLANEKDLDPSTVAKIGVSIGRSETIYTQAYALLRKIPRLASSKNKQEVLIADSAGAKDTRGLDYELITAISRDFAVRYASAIKAFVLVVPYQYFVIDRARLIVEQILELEEKIPMVLQSNRLGESIFIVVTKYDRYPNPREGLKLRLADLLQEEERTLAEEEKTPGHEHAAKVTRKRVAIWSFLNKLHESEQMHLFDVRKRTDRSKLMEKFVTKKSIPKHAFEKAMNQHGIERQFGKHIKLAIDTWERQLIQYYLEVLPSKIDQINERIRNLQEDISKIMEEDKGYKKSNAEIQERITQLRTDMQALKQLAEQATREQLLESDLVQRVQAESSRLKQNNLEAKQAQKELLTRQKTDTLGEIAENQERKSEFEASIADSRAEITQKETRITELSTGVHQEILKEISYEPDQEIRYGTYKPGKYQANHQQFREPTEDDLKEGYNKTVIAKDYNGAFLHTFKISREYRLVPRTQRERDVFLNLNQGGGYSATLDLHKAVIDLDTKSSDIGKSVLYNFRSTWNGTSDLPHIKVTYSIPKSEFHEADILNLRSEIAVLETDIAENTGQIRQLDEARLQLKAKRDSFDAQLQTIEQDIKKLEKEEIISNIKEFIVLCEESVKRYTSDIKSNTMRITQNEEHLRSVKEKLEEAQAEKASIIKTKRHYALIISRQKQILMRIASFAELIASNEMIDARSAKGQVYDDCQRFRKVYARSFDTLMQECAKDLSPDFMTHYPLTITKDAQNKKPASKKMDETDETTEVGKKLSDAVLEKESEKEEDRHDFQSSRMRFFSQVREAKEEQIGSQKLSNEPEKVEESETVGRRV